MARSEARGVGPALFDRDWSRVSGSWQGLAKNAQMVRAARGYSPAIFKPISKGGCHTGAQLKAQLTYLTTKSSHILDSRSHGSSRWHQRRGGPRDHGIRLREVLSR